MARPENRPSPAAHPPPVACPLPATCPPLVVSAGVATPSSSRSSSVKPTVATTGRGQANDGRRPSALDSSSSSEEVGWRGRPATTWRITAKLRPPTRRGEL
eukprot:scaffold36161_cov63-Phaeocystis_antarctica.AAC.5